jgi:serine/threonine-protein kinase
VDLDANVREGDILAAKYQVERVLGRGGMGVVVAAHHVQLGFRVALKFMLPSAAQHDVMRERFVREARAAGRLRGEHIARIMDFGVLENGAPYIVMEFLEGSDLDQLLRQRGRLPVHEAVDYVLQACKGMEEAHAQGIVHRDLKPQNLFLTRRPDGTPLVKVLDFGISKLADLEGQPLSMTASSAMMGSPLYMSPEQLRSSKSVDHRSDIYSLGAVLYQLVTAAVPVPAETIPELVERMLTGSILAPSQHAPEIDREFESVVMRCLARDPGQRYQSVAELVGALAPFGHPGRAWSGHASSVMGAADRSVPARSGVSTTLGQAAVSAGAARASRVTSAVPPWVWMALGAGALASAGAAAVLFSWLRAPAPAPEPAAPVAASATASAVPAPPAAVAPAPPLAAPTNSAATVLSAIPSASASAPAASAPRSPPQPVRRPVKPKSTASDPFSSPE